MTDPTPKPKLRLVRPGRNDDAGSNDDDGAGVVDVDIPDALPDLIVDKGNLPAAVREIRDLLAADGNLFDRGSVLVAVQRNADGGLFTHDLRVSNIVMRAHDVCRPMMWTKDGLEAVTLSDRVARMYLEWTGEWNVQPLAGITTAPLLRADGAIITARGYDVATEIYCDAPPAVSVLDRPTKADAEAALKKLRQVFRTFPFADAVMVRDKEFKVDVVNLDAPIGFAESGYLAALLTAVARPSLWLAPGVLLVAPDTSGAGAGKGLLARAITIIAYGIRPRAFPAGDATEFPKRLGAALMTGRPVALIDNVNGRMLKSETLASALTERPAEVRVLGYSTMVTLNAVACIVLTGNGLKLTEDLARRFLFVAIDPKMDDPETRPFKDGFLDGVEGRRIELLEYALTILRWGRQNADQLKRGRPLGSYEQWAEWVRDPLLNLGVADPVEAMLSAKQTDPHRLELGELFSKWYEIHGSAPVTAAGLDEDVKGLLDPTSKGRQYIAYKVEQYVDTRIAGYVLTRQKNPGKWAVARYRLLTTDARSAADNDDEEWTPKLRHNNEYWIRRYADRKRWREAWRRGTLEDDPEVPDASTDA